MFIIYKKKTVKYSISVLPKLLIFSPNIWPDSIVKINVREFVTGTAKDKSEIDNKNKC